MEHNGQSGDVDALPGKTNRTGSALALAETAARSYTGEGEKKHWRHFPRDCQSDRIAQTARNSSGMAQGQAKDAAETLSSDPKGSKTARFCRFYSLKLDC